MTKEKLTYLVLSDIHLGHSINKCENIVNNLRDYFKTNHKLFKTLDVIFIAGDIFDKLLITSSKDFILATEWITELILYCKSNNIRLRILEGTPSHDWRQAKLISSIIEKLDIQIDYKYVDTLYIETMNDWGFTILYIPDEYKNKASDTWKDVKKLLVSNKLTKVDVAIMHGQFNYQLPFLLESSHIEEDYLSIVNYYISIGHIHTPSIYKRIIAQGSFDRLAHGEEEDKGACVISITKDGDMDFKMIYNTKAMKFKTINATDLSIEEITKLLDKEKTGNIRLMSNNEEYLTKNIKMLNDSYPNLNIKVERKKVKEKKIKLLDDTMVINSFNITKENIKELLDTEMKKHKLTKEEWNIYEKELKDIVEKIS